MKTAGTSGQSAADSEIIAQLDGGWRLVKIEQPDAKGAVKTARVNGLLVFTRDGHMAVQVRNLEPGHVDSAYSRGGYEASFGKNHAGFRKQHLPLSCRGSFGSRAGRPGFPASIQLRE